MPPLNRQRFVTVGDIAVRTVNIVYVSRHDNTKTLMVCLSDESMITTLPFDTFEEYMAAWNALCQQLNANT